MSAFEPETNSIESNDLKTLSLTGPMCETMIKWTLLELATNTFVDHWDYCRGDIKKVSPLVESINAHGGRFDLGIKSLANSISSNLHIKNILKVLDELHAGADNNVSDELLDNIYDLETELFDLFINLSGLYEINSLHVDSVYNISEHLFDLIYSR